MADYFSMPTRCTLWQAVRVGGQIISANQELIGLELGLGLFTSRKTFKVRGCFCAMGCKFLFKSLCRRVSSLLTFIQAPHPLQAMVRPTEEVVNFYVQRNLIKEPVSSPSTEQFTSRALPYLHCLFLPSYLSIIQ